MVILRYLSVFLDNLVYNIFDGKPNIFETRAEVLFYESYAIKICCYIMLKMSFQQQCNYIPQIF